MMTLKNKSVLVLGLGETGLSMLRWLSVQGARLRAADSRSAPPGLVEAKQYLAEPLIRAITAERPSSARPGDYRIER
jgi:UDP-N-acetylmuramoylalanine--D-glutamate ligase